MRLYIGPRPKCGYDTCDLAAKYHSPQLCGGHYAQLWAGQPLKPLYARRIVICRLCTITHYSGGLCRNHYEQARRADKRRAEGRMRGLACSEPTCNDSVYARQLCRSHYLKRRRKEAGPCKITGCKNAAATARRCSTHYQLYLIDRRQQLILTNKAA